MGNPRQLGLPSEHDVWIAIKGFVKVQGSPQDTIVEGFLLRFESSMEKKDRSTRDHVGLVRYGLYNID